MGQSVIDGDSWIAERLASLRGLRTDGLTPDQRTAVEAEIAALSNERDISQGSLPWVRGLRMRWLRRYRARAGRARDRAAAEGRASEYEDSSPSDPS